MLATKTILLPFVLTLAVSIKIIEEAQIAQEPPSCITGTQPTQAGCVFLSFGYWYVRCVQNRSRFHSVSYGRNALHLSQRAGIGQKECGRDRRSMMETVTEKANIARRAPHCGKNSELHPTAPTAPSPLCLLPGNEYPLCLNMRKSNPDR